MPEGVAAVAAEERVIDLVTLTAELSVIGGIPASGLNFGAATNTQAIIDQTLPFDFDSGGLVLCSASPRPTARAISTSPSSVPRLAGAGGFINISQNAKAVVFVGTFTAGALAVSVRDGRLVIEQEGKSKSSSPDGCDVPQRVRAQARPAGTLRDRALRVPPRRARAGFVEVAPGIDIERDILAHMEFRPTIDDPQIMDEAIFEPTGLGLRARMLELPLERRFSYDEKLNVLFINFERLAIKTVRDVARIKAEVERRVRPVTSSTPSSTTRAARSSRRCSRATAAW